MKIMWLRKFFHHLSCRHNFRLQDLELTGIEPLPRPTSKDYKDWERWWSSVDTHESHTKRVLWPCCKCGKVFYAHYGLEISPSHGPIVPDKSD